MGRGDNGDVVKVSDPVARVALTIIIGLCTFGAKQIWNYNDTLVKHTGQIEALQASEAKMEQTIDKRLERIEMRQERLIDEVRKK